MLRRFDLWWLALLALLGVRLWLMASLPLMDTSEPRYAEIARTMLTTGDWITPWFEPGVPFWGKPPLSFWGQALTMQIGGVNELAVRMPSLLVTVLTLVLIYRFASRFWGQAIARLAVIIGASSLLMWVDAGAAITDPYLTLGVTLSLVAFAMAQVQPTVFWRYGFFVGMAIGLLAKGPLALVLIGFSVAVWWWRCSDRRACWRALPWGRGSLLTALLSLPWYIAAELKTPGFLQYFLVGEHILRFLDPGWRGDLYGNGHQRPHGMIWLYLLVAALPWTPVMVVAGVKRWWQGAHSIVNKFAIGNKIGTSNQFDSISNGIDNSEVDSLPLHAYLLAWAAVCGLLFTPAGNVLPTYVQPSLPALAVLAAWWLQASVNTPSLQRQGLKRLDLQPRNVQNGAAIFTLMFSLVLGGASVWASQHEAQLKTEKSLVAYHQATASAATPLVFLNRRPYSAQFYSRGRAFEFDAATLAKYLSDTPTTVQIAMTHRSLNALNRRLPAPLKVDFSNQRYALITLNVDDVSRLHLIAALKQSCAGCV